MKQYEEEQKLLKERIKKNRKNVIQKEKKRLGIE
jgi:hypothetical protein